MYPLEGTKDKDTASMICGADAVLVVKAGVPNRLELPLLPRLGISPDLWVVFVEGGIVLTKKGRYPRLVLVGRFRKYEAGDFSRFRSGEADQETCL